MIVYRESWYSRHTPKDLSSYSFEKKDPKTLTKGQKKALIEAAYETAEENLQKYQLNKALKYGAYGGLSGAALAALLRDKGTGVLGPVVGAGLLGATVGGVAGSIRGDYLGRKEGHDPDKRAKRLGRKYDEYVRSNKLKGEDDDYELYAKGYIRDKDNLNLQREQLDTQRQIMLNTLFR